MSLIPEGENLKRALAWIGEERQTRHGEKLIKILEEASVRFDLTPAQEQWLIQLLTSS